MSINQNGYFRRKNKGMLRGKDYGFLTMLNENLLFISKHGNEITIPIKDIVKVESSYAVVHFYLKDGDYYFHVQDHQYEGATFTRALNNRDKARRVVLLIKHLIPGEEKEI